MPKPRFNALTLRAAGNVRAFECEVGVSEAFDRDSGLQHPPVLRHRGIWDTGASGSVITAKVVADLGLQAIDRTVAKTANGVRQSDVYLVNVLLPSHVGFTALRVTDGNLAGVDVLIGMDIICQGDFTITHDGDGVVMSYRVPRDGSRTIDFVAEANRPKRWSRRTPRKTRRRS